MKEAAKRTYEDWLRLHQFVDTKIGKLPKHQNDRTHNYLNSLSALSDIGIPIHTVSIHHNPYTIKDVWDVLETNNKTYSELGLKGYGHISTMLNYNGLSFNDYVHSKYNTLSHKVSFVLYTERQFGSSFRLAIILDRYTGVETYVDLPLYVLDEDLYDGFFNTLFDHESKVEQ